MKIIGIELRHLVGPMRREVAMFGCDLVLPSSPPQWGGMAYLEITVHTSLGDCDTIRVMLPQPSPGDRLDAFYDEHPMRRDT